MPCFQVHKNHCYCKKYPKRLYLFSFLRMYCFFMLCRFFYSFPFFYYNFDSFC